MSQLGSIDRYLAEIGLTRRDLELVAPRADLLERHVGIAARRFYARLEKTEIGSHIAPDEVPELLASRIAHWRRLIRGDFERLADDHVEHFGRRRVEAGLPTRASLLAAEGFATEFARFVAETPEIPEEARADLAIVLTKLAFLDLVLACAAHEISYLD